tara:strand:- start:28 stop:852 length:825 start_codon:yes stop_codon:yes gene_type:complete
MSEYRPPVFGSEINVFNPRFFNFGEVDALTEAYLDRRYIQFPTSQYEECAFSSGIKLNNSSALTFTDGTSINTAPQHQIYSNVYSDPSLVGDVGLNTRYDVGKVSWSWAGGDYDYENAVISIQYNLNTLCAPAYNYYTDVRFNDTGHIEIHPFLLHFGGVSATLDGTTQGGSASTGSNGLAYTGRSYWDWGQTTISNIACNLYAEFIFPNNYITLYTYNKNNSVLIAFGTPYQMVQAQGFTAEVVSNGLYTTALSAQTGSVNIVPLDNEIKPYP